MEALARDRSLAGRPLVFPRGDEQSGEFYSRVYLGRDIEHLSRTGDAALIAQRIREARPDALLVVERPAWEKLDGELRRRYGVVAETPHWVALSP